MVKELCTVNVTVVKNERRSVRTIIMTAANDEEIESKIQNWLRIVRLGRMDAVERYDVVKRSLPHSQRRERDTAALIDNVALANNE